MKIAKSQKPRVKIAIIIPARWGSTRFPGKPLHPIIGKPMLQHVWERCLEVKNIAHLIIATDDNRIAEVALHFGAEVCMTSKLHSCGTDRIAEASAKLRGVTHIFNIQGDYPLIASQTIDLLVSTIIQDPKIAIISAATKFFNVLHAKNPNRVKVVTGIHGNALYFSRSYIPFHFNKEDSANNVLPLLHCGIYGYRHDILRKITSFSPTPLEQCENLEQMRALEHGIPIRIVEIPHDLGIAIDTPDDAKELEKLLQTASVK